MSTPTPDKSDKDVLEQNVETLLESGGEPPRISDLARTRIRQELVAHATTAAPRRSPLVAIGLGIVAAAAAALIVTRVVGDDGRIGVPAVKDGLHQLADGTTWITEGTSKVTMLGDRRVRVEGAALLDVAPGNGTFIVETTQGTIKVLGTRFLVDASATRTTAAVVRGLVQLATSAGDVTLHAGEQAVAEPGRPPTRGPAPRLSHLVSWAAEARRKAEHDVTPLHNGTLFARDPARAMPGASGEEYPLPIVKLGIDVVVENQVARIALDQTFHNNADRDLEGVYRFAIPPDAALQRLAMYVDGRLTESAVVERMRARRIYEELVYRRVDPALLEWTGTGRLNLRVYPLPARQDKRLVLAYTQSLPTLYDDWTLAVPLPEIDAPVGEMAVEMTLRGCANCEITSPSHAIAVTRKGDDAHVSYRKQAVTIGDSLVLRVRDTRKAATTTRASDGRDRFVMVRAPIDLPTAPRAYRPRTWVILDDVSASRGLLERRAQADMVDAFVRELDEEDRLAVVAFDVAARQKLAPTRVLDIDRRALRASLSDEGDVGATDLSAALTAATALLAGTPPDDAMIVYLGDGVITSGPRQLDELRAQLVGKAHFIGVGIGDGPDTQALESLAAATGGYTTTLDLADDVAWRTFDLVAALHTTRATGITARLVDASGALVPATTYVRSPQLADGEQLELVAKLTGEGTPAAVELVGTVDGAPWQQRVAIADGASTAGYLPRLWAQRHVAARLLAKHDAVVVPVCTALPCPSEAELRETRDEAIRKDVVELGKQYFLLSRHTSLIVLENDAMYAQYGVRKGSGDTWAPYALPTTIAVVKGTTARIKAADVADDAELFRVAPSLFSVDGGFGDEDSKASFGTIGLGARGTGEGGGGTGNGYGIGNGVSGRSRRDLGVDKTQAQAAPDEAERDVSEEAEKSVARKSYRVSGSDEEMAPEQKAAPRRIVTTTDLVTSVLEPRRSRGGTGGGLFSLQRYGWPQDPAYDDLSTLVPALFADTVDAVRAKLPPRGTHAMDEAAKTLLARAREALATGVYRWGDREIAIDAQRHWGWKQTTGAGVAETASFDGATVTRRYAELGLDVTRAVGADDIALALAALPVWIAEPDHYAAYFDVRSKSAREVALSTTSAGTTTVAYVLVFDAAHHLVAVRDGKGAELVAVTWGPTGPTAARVFGRTLAVGFTGQAIADATAWAHSAPAQAVVVELPGHLPMYWTAQLATVPLGSPGWIRVQRQLIASLAATSDRNALFTAYEALRAQTSVALGDLVLASSGIASSSNDAQVAAALAPFATEPAARYLIAGRAWTRQPRAQRLVPETTTGAIGALWQLREIAALVYGGDNAKTATRMADRIVALPARAPDFKLVAATLSNNRYGVTPADIIRIWSSVATGETKNVARANAVTMLANRGAYDDATEQLALLVDQLDLAAVPPQLPGVMYWVQQSRRGLAGWQLLWGQWRDRVLAGSSYEHVMSLATLGVQQPTDLPAIFARATALAGDDVDRQVAIAQFAMRVGQLPYAQQLVDKLVATHPTRELHQLAAQFATQQQRPAAALAHLEAAQAAAGDEAVSISTVRAELSAIIATARLLALQTTGAERTDAVNRAMAWGAKWRAVDLGNVQIDRTLGELQLAVGNKAEAWRQLSGVIERDPMSGTGYQTVAETFEAQGRVADALDFWQQAIVLEQTNPTPRLRKAQALIALGRTADGDALLAQIARGTWHEMWSGTVYQAKSMLQRSKQVAPTR